jgi:hypothetical protein
MANRKQLALIKRGVTNWNKWREDNPSIKPDLSGANLRFAVLNGANLQGVNLTNSNLELSSLVGTNLRGANFTGSNLSQANIYWSELSVACFRKANLYQANLIQSEFIGADFSEANLKEIYCCACNFSEANFNATKLIDCDLSKSMLIGAKFNDATLQNCRVYGISAWDLEGLDEANQANLIVTPFGDPDIEVDNLEVAQFIYIMLNSAKMRSIIDTITSKLVLVIGRFSPERKIVLDAICQELRQYNYVPILFDFNPPRNRDLTETLSTLAHLARFVIADITDAKSIPQELSVIVPNLPSVPIKPILLSSEQEYGMFEHFVNYPWVLAIHRYYDLNELLKSMHS